MQSFFLPGHGAIDDRDRNYLIPVDAKINLLEDSAIPMRRINEVLDDRKRITVEKVIVIGGVEIRGSDLISTPVGGGCSRSW